VSLVCQTSRLIIRTWSLDDAEAAFAIWGDPRVMRYIDPEGLRKNIDDARASLAKAIAYQEKNGFCRWAVEAKSTGKVVASCGFYKLSTGDLDLGFYVQPDYWRQGIATEAATKCINHGFDTMGLKRIFASTDPDNTASQCVLGKLQFEGLGMRPADDSPEIMERWFVKSPSAEK
jgi:[ribosomal protein S5]-alanine N-acetyltransferase